MSDIIEKQQPKRILLPGEPGSDKNSATEENTEGFLRELFAKGRYFEKSFSNLCEAGCPAKEFGRRLWATCVIMSLGSIPLINGGKLSKAQLRRLPTRLRALAEIIHSLNATSLAPANEAKAAPYNPQGQPAREYLIRRYEMLPGMLNVYASHLERFSNLARKAVKRLTLGHVVVIKMLRYVEERTGTPRYAEMADLLQQGCFIVERTKSTPKFLSAEALAKMYQRSSKYL
jgi:hypothetical protein